jgi:chitodextrinase
MIRKITLYTILTITSFISQPQNILFAEEEDVIMQQKTSFANTATNSQPLVTDLAIQNNVIKNNLSQNTATAQIFNSSSFDNNKIYLGGDIVRIGGKVFKANWWTAGVNPEQNYGAGEPWSLIEDKSTNSLAINSWASGKTYTKGDVVTQDNKIYMAKWWTQDSPTKQVDQNGSWELIQSMKNGADVTVSDAVLYSGSTTFKKGAIIYIEEDKIIYNPATEKDDTIKYRTYYEANQDVIANTDPKTNNRGAQNPWTMLTSIKDSVATTNEGKNIILETIQTTLPKVPDAAINVKATQQNDNIILSWTDNNQDTAFNKYDVYQGTTKIADDLTSRSLNLTGLKSGTTYDFKIITQNKYGDSTESKYSYTTPKTDIIPISNNIQNTTATQDTARIGSNIITGIKVENISDKGAIISWNPIENADYYEISLNGSNATPQKTNTNYIKFENLPSNTQHQYFIKGVNEYKATQNASTISKEETAFGMAYFVTNNSTTPSTPNTQAPTPNTQTNTTETLQVTPIATNQNTNTQATTHIANQSYNGGEMAVYNNSVYKANWWTNTTPGSDSSWTFVSANSAPNAPTGLQTSMISSKGISLSWTPNGYATSYEVQVFKDLDGTKSSYTSETPLQTITSSGTSTYIGSLDPNTKYDFRVKAINSSGASDFSTALNDVATKNITTTSTTNNMLFSPYIDTSLNNFSKIIENIIKTENIFSSNAKVQNGVTLAFLQSNSAGGLGWAGVGDFKTNDKVNYINLQNQYSERSIKDIITDLQKKDLDVMISIGGMFGTDPAVYADEKGQSSTQLADLFQSVLTKYNLKKLDFDVEAGARFKPNADKIRGQAINIIEDRMGGDDKVEIVFTLPVMQTGLVPDGIDTIKTTISQGATIDRINIMAMDYGTKETDMGQAAISAIKNTAKQLDELGLHNVTIGVIPMIGINDTVPEKFTLDDAREVYEYSLSDQRVEEISFWSLGRDIDDNLQATVDSNIVSPVHSGIHQTDYQFSQIFQGLQ